MAKIYYRLIKAGMFTIGNVPEHWKAETQELLGTSSADDATTDSKTTTTNDTATTATDTTADSKTTAQ